MTVLSIDTSIPTLRVGVSKEKTLAISALEPPVTHAEAILPAVEQVLQKAGITINNIELLAIAGGPGSFTGLRIGIATAKGLSLGLGIPMVLVPTLDIYGWAWRELEGIVVPVVDARKHRVYCARYSFGQRIGDWMDIELTQLIWKIHGEDKVHFVGPDAELAEAICLEREGWILHRPNLEKEIESLSVLGINIYLEKGGANDTAGPIYLREPEIGTPIAR
ncbi:MAG TPA: tRNA (adenosine(37)-N6)-threonylcarbamoyltransferase complex dimerization subunit type 1 TsaB [Rectinema sp.]|nr:tRNA (adenosine(37)-N6)-threonylcarbamoyltransferase complex dimerization subunit type 1 TsaB [Rectinema sp.]